MGVVVIIGIIKIRFNYFAGKVKRTVMKNKYNYSKVIQQHYGQGWEDVSEYETNSKGISKELHTDGKSLIKHDYREYCLTGYPTRVVSRRELNKVLNTN